MSINNKSYSQTPIGTSSNLGTFVGRGDIILTKVFPYKSSSRMKSMFLKTLDDLIIDGRPIEKHTTGSIYISNDCIYCGTSVYPFSKIRGIIRNGINSFQVTVDSSDKKFKMNLEIRTEKQSELFSIFNKLMNDKIESFSAKRMHDQKKYFKDRLGFDRY